MEGSKDSKSEKCLPFRKRCHNIRTTEEKRLQEKTSHVDNQELIQSKRDEATSSKSPSGESNFHSDFENLHLLAEVTSGSLDAEDCIPVTVESLPSTSTSTAKKHPFSCSYCQKKFHHKGDMNKHLRSHTKEQPYKCTFCQLKFSHTSNLQRHLRIHTGSKPHSCEYCNRTFSRIDKLHLHQKHEVCKRNKSH